MMQKNKKCELLKRSL
jgi:hypothetical protein